MKDFDRFLVALGLIMVLFALWMFADCALAEGVRIGVYTVDANGGLNVRRGPDIEYRSICTLSDGAEIVILEICDNWGLAQWQNHISDREPMGWVCMDYLVKKYDIIVNLED